MTIYSDLKAHTKAVIALALGDKTVAGDVNGNIIDQLGFDCGKIVIATGTVTAGTVVLKEIQESVNSEMSDATVIPADAINGDLTVLSTANAITEVGYINSKRYVRPVFTFSATPNLIVGAVIEKAGAEYLPA